MDKSQSSSQKKSPTDISWGRIVKTIDAQIDFNKFLMSKYLSNNPQDIAEFMLSMYIDFSEINSIKLSDSSIKKIKLFSTEFTKLIIRDLQQYKEIKLLQKS